MYNTESPEILILPLLANYKVYLVIACESTGEKAIHGCCITHTRLVQQLTPGLIFGHLVFLVTLH